MATMCWSITEIVRFMFYTLKQLNWDMSWRNPIGNIVGHLRYNLFIVLYPLGVSGELVCFYKTWQYV